MGIELVVLVGLTCALALGLAAFLARGRLGRGRWRLTQMSRDYSIRWSALDATRKRAVLRSLGVLTSARGSGAASVNLDRLFAGILAGARAAVRDGSDVALIETELMLAFLPEAQSPEAAAQRTSG